MCENIFTINIFILLKKDQIDDGYKHETKFTYQVMKVYTFMKTWKHYDAKLSAFFFLPYTSVVRQYFINM